jgi:hypothetical protein
MGRSPSQERFRFRPRERSFVTLGRLPSRRRNDRPSNAGRHGRSSLLFARGLVEYPALTGLVGRGKRVPNFRHGGFAGSSATRADDLPKARLGRRCPRVVDCWLFGHDVVLLTRETDCAGFSLWGFPGAFCCRHSPTHQLVHRLQNEFADHPRGPLQELLSWAHAHRPRVRKPRSGDDSDVSRIARCHQATGRGRRTVDGRDNPPCAPGVRRPAVSCARYTAAIGKADRSSSAENISRPLSRWLYRQTYSFTYPCSHFGDTA